jgi:hypothetical protein
MMFFLVGRCAEVDLRYYLSAACCKRQQQTKKWSFRGAWKMRVLSDRNFRDVVLGLLFLSGVGLVWSSIGLH